MKRRGMRPEDISLFGWAHDPQLSPDGTRVVWTEVTLDAERDAPVSRVMIADTDGTTEPRPFSEGPGDFQARWSPGGEHVAFLAASDGPPSLRLASLAGGAATRVETPGAVSWISWSPLGDRIALVVNIPDRAPDAEPSARQRNEPRVVRGLNSRVDGLGWREGRDHVFVYDVAACSLRKLTSGPYDHSFPAFSPDGTRLVFEADRSRGADDRMFRGHLFTVGVDGGRPRQVTRNVGFAMFPTFSPDGRFIAFTGFLGTENLAGREAHLYVVESDGGEPERIAPDLDLGVWIGLGQSSPFAWLSDDELLFSVSGPAVTPLVRARRGRPRATTVVDGEIQTGGFSVVPPRGRRRSTIAYAAAWVDQPSEIFCTTTSPDGGKAVQVSHAGRRLTERVELAPVERFTASAPDGLEIEYFVMPPVRTAPRRRARPDPVFVEIHGGPQLFSPWALLLASYQTLAAAGYAIVMPNPRGSIGYGEPFTAGLGSAWGAADLGDVLACVDDAIDRGLADAERQFVGGYSYGGFMSAWTVGHTDRFRAACIGAPVVDHASMFGTTDSPAFLADSLRADPWSGAAVLAAHSPITYAPKVTTPVLLYVNEGDLRCPATQALEYFVALRWLRKESEFVVYPGGSHGSGLPIAGPPSQAEDRYRRILDWLGRHGGVAVG